ncbi:halocyanin domain-containing protein [Halorientalis regularis]|uniref:Halocyanin domain-containing protein n=1 Tax=Halorientalis regularis TaxID=660518 RepID=A0A1G7F6A8_9EURY|nr:halocyanin domain-containing protein [Halorientalis regularis]SDE71411.1 halocyanin domain-containing protein [Halorientalis regularis]
MTVAGALAGCSGGGNNGDGGDDGGDGNNTTTSGGGGASVPGEVDTYLSDNDANGYDGSAADMTGQDTVEISVGAGDRGYAFDPAAAVVSAGTEVTWVWTGNGGQHNVVSTDDAFESERQSSAGATFAHTFEEAGNYTYYCVPHEALGMHGAVIVE